MSIVTGELMLKNLAPGWLLGDGLHRGKLLIMVTKRGRFSVRAVASSDWLALG